MKHFSHLPACPRAAASSSPAAGPRRWRSCASSSRRRPRLTVFAADPAPEIEAWAQVGRLALHRRRPWSRATRSAPRCSTPPTRTRRRTRGPRPSPVTAARWSTSSDDLHHSQFITPAIVDRDPVTVAIGTEGAAPRPGALHQGAARGEPARLARPAWPASARRSGAPPRLCRRAAPVAPSGAEWYHRAGPEAAARGDDALRPALDALLTRHRRVGAEPGSVAFVGAGPGEPDLMTLRARPRARRGRRGDPRPAGAGAHPGARSSRGRGDRGGQDGLRTVDAPVGDRRAGDPTRPCRRARRPPQIRRPQRVRPASTRRSRPARRRASPSRWCPASRRPRRPRPPSGAA